MSVPEKKDHEVKPFEPHEVHALRAILKEREFRKMLLVLLGKFSALVPWVAGAIMLWQGEYLEALKWFK